MVLFYIVIDFSPTSTTTNARFACALYLRPEGQSFRALFDKFAFLDILPALKEGDSYQCPLQAMGYSRWVLVADLSMKFTSQALRACPALTFYYAWTIARPRPNTFNAPTTSAFSV